MAFPTPRDLAVTSPPQRRASLRSPASQRFDPFLQGRCCLREIVGFFLEQHREALFVEDRHLKSLREHAPHQPRYWDRKRETGRLVMPWNLIVPERVLNRVWAEVA
jgi:hypothetical protein